MNKFILRVCALLLLLPFTVCMPLAFAEEPSFQIKAGDILCFGTPDEASGFDGKWLVLDPDHTNTGEDGIFVVSLNLVGNDQGAPLLFRDIGDVTVSFADRGEAFAQDHPGSNDYQGSDIQQWCAEFPAHFLRNGEQQALMPTAKSDSEISIPASGMPTSNAANASVDFSAAESILNGDTIFLLSAEEITNEAYGFTDQNSRVALFKGAAAGYWLRSPHTPSFPLDVGFVFSFGAVMDFPVNAKFMYSMSTYARPACNLDRTKIADVEELYTEESTTVWRITFQGDTPNEQAYDLSWPAQSNEH